MAGECLNLVSGDDPKPRPDADQQQTGDTTGHGESSGRKGRFLGITFACCDVYARIYLNRDATAYEGRCPRCFKTVKVEIGSGGTSSRFFTAY